MLTRDFASDAPARHACLFALALIPLLGGAALVATEEILRRRLLPVALSGAPGGSSLALNALQNASADPRLHSVIVAAGVIPVLREAACTLPPNVSGATRACRPRLPSAPAVRACRPRLPPAPSPDWALAFA